MDRNVIEYLPEFMRKYKEMQTICNIEQEHIQEIWKEIEKIWDNQFIKTADEETIARWEQMLKIKTKGTGKLRDRINKVSSLVAEQRPYTDETLKIILKAIFGEGNYSVEYIEPFNMLISVSFESENEIKNIKEVLGKVLPANLRWEVDIFHNKHSLINQYTHEQLENYMHDDIRNNYMFKTERS